MSVRRKLTGALTKVRRPKDEKGAYAVLMSMMLVLVIALAAIAVDIASQVSAKQQLKDTMDAAAHAGAFKLDDGIAAARAEITRVARANDPTANPMVDTWCVVASTGADRRVLEVQIPSTCDPGKGAPYTAATYPGLVCDENYCFIPCNPSLAGAKCNTVRVADEKVVPYAFAPAIGYDEGSTGAVVSVACKGPCGTEVPNPMDVVIMADRTASMEYADRQQMKSAIVASLGVMNPEMHYVAFGALHKSRTSGFTPSSKTYGPQNDDFGVTGGSDSSSKLNYNGHWDGTGDTNGDGICRSEAFTNSAASTSTKVWQWKDSKGNVVAPPSISSGTADSTVTNGQWIVVPFANDYVSGTENPVINTRSALVDAISCLPQSRSGEFGTHLAGSLKGAVRYALDTNPNPYRAGRAAKVRKVVIFETDGMPDELVDFGNSSLTTGDTGTGRQYDSRGRITGNGARGCTRFKEVAERAKAQDVLIITIGFGDAATEKCNKNGTGENVRDVLAAAASNPLGSSQPSRANSCRGADIALENNDGDFFFCATDGSDLADIFTTALTSLNHKIKLLKMPS